MAQSIYVDIAEVYESAKRLQTSLSRSVLPSEVNTWSGPPQIDASARFQATMARAAEALGIELAGLMQLLDTHAETLRAAAETLEEIEDDATTLTNEAEAGLASARDITLVLDQSTLDPAQTVPGVADVDHEQRSDGA